ncbi:hypothetical protein [Kribbella lupini]|uniref:Apea-like HEPN domain-containing protein n=1 Tax=Kribbella lupini TaxID=291602 RepID=A0ABP4N2B8_9ACTN
MTQLTFDLTPKWKSQHGLILSSSAVAAAEDYFRTILTEIVNVCEYCAQRVEPLETRMEFVFSGSVAEAVRGLLDTSSLSSKENVTGWAKKIAGTAFKDSRSLLRLLDEFERICHIRHAAMHAGGQVSTRNARVLKVPPNTWISFGSPQAIYDITSVIVATLRSFNQTLFENILREWLDQNHMSGSWSDDASSFTALWELFKSTGDIESNRTTGDKSLNPNAYQAYRSIRSSVAARRAAGAT